MLCDELRLLADNFDNILPDHQRHIHLWHGSPLCWRSNLTSHAYMHLYSVHSHFAGRLYPNVTIASPSIQFRRSFSSNGPAASCRADCIEPGEPALPEMTWPRVTELTTASISSLVMSPSHRETFLLIAGLGRYSLVSHWMLPSKGQPSGLELSSVFSKLVVETDYNAWWYC